MDFAGQVRAARAYLKWSQEEFADKARLSLAGIQKIEREESHPNNTTRSKIIRAMEKVGIVFTDKGIDYIESPIFFVEGKTHEEAYLKLLADAYEHLSTSEDKELLIMNADDSVSPPAVNDMYRQMRADGITMRQLIQEGNTHILGALDEYRYIPKPQFLNRVTLIYGDRVARETKNVLRGSINLDPINAEIQRNTFNILWSALKQPLESTADERF